MPRRPQRSVPVVLVPGWEGSEEGHWQRWLAGQLTEAGREVHWADLGDVDDPSLDRWLSGLRATLAPLPADGFDLVAHSLGAVLWLHHAADPGDSPRPARVALVSPPSPGTTIEAIAEFFPPPIDIDAVRRAADGTVLVAGDDDPYLPEGIAAAYATPLKIATTVVPGGAHLNTAAGFGEWPAVLDWCRRDNLAFY
ncbi:MAG: RBBP9/YdeN family alpha/beta hydrolase [Jatrophihabitans sp.]|uniref:RBBP9/YdeN family alpha/beta hydrolase n=1 Tax=Jatrophihabitans sp. TaxID=1932789 RepID=UPI003F7EF933